MGPAVQHSNLSWYNMRVQNQHSVNPATTNQEEHSQVWGVAVGREGGGWSPSSPDHGLSQDRFYYLLILLNFIHS